MIKKTSKKAVNSA